MYLHICSTMNEQNRIPFHELLLPARQVTIFAPHADDETLGCGGAILRHKSKGAFVRVVVMTDGAAGGDPATRRQEVQKACACLGVDELVQWDFSDRALGRDFNALTRIVQEELFSHPPDLVYVTSPWELHPDHEKAARAVWHASSRLKSAPATIAFYEVGTPLQPNVLTDITPFVEKKKEAASHFGSQFHSIPYDDLAISLNAFRSLTLRGLGVTHAEAFYVFPGHAARNRDLSQRMHPAFGVVPLPVPMTPWKVVMDDKGQPVERWDASVIVRTKNRPIQLKQALNSIWAQSRKPLEIIVANDGSPLPPGLLSEHEGVAIRELLPEKSGRSAVWNLAAKVARGRWLLILDDDDIWYPDHVSSLFDAVTRSPEARFAYSDALRSEWGVQSNGKWNKLSGPYPFKGGAFDWQRLLSQNFIPTCGWAVRRDHFFDVGGIDESLELLEDWDFLIRACRDGSQVVYSGAITSEYRFLVQRNEHLDWTDARLSVQAKYPEIFTHQQLTQIIQDLSAENDLFTKVGD